MNWDAITALSLLALVLIKAAQVVTGVISNRRTAALLEQAAEDQRRVAETQAEIGANYSKGLDATMYMAGTAGYDPDPPVELAEVPPPRRRRGQRWRRKGFADGPRSIGVTQMATARVRAGAC